MKTFKEFLDESFNNPPKGHHEVEVFVSHAPTRQKHVKKIIHVPGADEEEAKRNAEREFNRKFGYEIHSSNYVRQH